MLSFRLGKTKSFSVLPRRSNHARIVFRGGGHQLKLDGSFGFLLNHNCAVTDAPNGNYIADPHLNHITAAQLAVDGEIEQRSVAQSSMLGDQITKANLGVQPTITIRPGAPVRLVVHKDLVLAPVGNR